MHSEQEASPAFPKFARKCYQGWDHNPLQLRQLCQGLAQRKGTRRQNIAQKRPRGGSRTSFSRHAGAPARGRAQILHEFPYTNSRTRIFSRMCARIFLQTCARIFTRMCARMSCKLAHEFPHGFFTNFYTNFYTDFSRIFTRIFTRIFCERFTCRK